MSEHPETANVICIKWGQKYGPDYVNKLHSMVSRNLSRPFRFICFTDDAAGIDPAIETRPLPLTGIAEFDNREAWTRAHGWLKVTSFAPDLGGLAGPTLFLDLDIVIVGTLDPFFDLPGRFLVIKEWDKRDATGNTSVYRFEAGDSTDLLDHLRGNLASAQTDFRNEQEFVTDYFHRTGQLTYWPKGWCVSFKRHCIPWPLGWFGTARIPEGARVVTFHGKPNPHDVIAGNSGKWYRRVRPAAWVEELWR